MIYKASEFDPHDYIAELPLMKRKRGNPKSRQNEYYYKDVICAFDIETTKLKIGTHNAGTQKHPHYIDDYIAIMYIWQFQIGNDITVYGRTWEEFNIFIDQLVSALNGFERLLIYVHFLGHEFQFLRDMKILGRKISEESVFCTKPRTPIKFLACDDHLEFRCSMILSNMGLDMFTKQMKVEHQKLSGDDYDYNKLRFPWTPIDEETELPYCINDVMGLVEAVQKRMALDNDNAYTVPLTSTGFVRRDMKRAIHDGLPYNYIPKQLPDYETYQMLRQAFRGGNTHASRCWSGKRVDGDIRCMDISSSYPNVLINCKFPVTPFYDVDKYVDESEIDGLINKGRALLMRVTICDIHLKDQYYPVPYLSRDKCWNIYNAAYDNGRIYDADSVETAITDIDYQIIKAQYNCRVYIQKIKFASYGYLPDCIRNVVREYFYGKTTLKGVEDMEEMYNKLKALLNACYGMAAQNPVKEEEAYKDGHYITGARYTVDVDGKKESRFLKHDEAVEHDIDIYEFLHTVNMDKSTMPYQWGVWCTAWARERLERAIRICGDRFLYCDTDSVYYLNSDWFDAPMVDFSEYNRNARKDSKKNSAYADDPKGRTHYMGELELDKTAKSFKTFGAKKYAYIDADGELHITIAGVNKRKGAKELDAHAKKWNKKHPDKDQKDGLDIMTTGFVFDDAGGTESIYNDEPIEHFEIDGHDLYVPTNVVINPSTYKVGLGDDYRTLLNFLLDNEIWGLYQKNWENAHLPSLEV